MAEFIPDREARKGGTQFTENTAVICERCEGEMKEYEPGGLRADSRSCVFLHVKNKQTKNNTAPEEAANSHLEQIITDGILLALCLDRESIFPWQNAAPQQGRCVCSPALGCEVLPRQTDR